MAKTGDRIKDGAVTIHDKVDDMAMVIKELSNKISRMEL